MSFQVDAKVSGPQFLRSSNDGNGEHLGANLPAEFKTAPSGEHQVQDDEIGISGGDRPESGSSSTSKTRAFFPRVIFRCPPDLPGASKDLGSHPFNPVSRLSAVVSNVNSRILKSVNTVAVALDHAVSNPNAPVGERRDS
jgi:hypothetical protein